MKTIDLTSQDRPEVELSLSGQTWRIRRVVIAAYQLYQQLTGGANEAQRRFAELQNRLAAGKADDSDVLAMQRELAADADRRQDLTYQCIASILEANGYEFDRDWWEHNSDRHEQQAFIGAALNKDLQNLPAGKKKEKGA